MYYYSDCLYKDVVTDVVCVDQPFLGNFFVKNRKFGQSLCLTRFNTVVDVFISTMKTTYLFKF